MTADSKIVEAFFIKEFNLNKETCNIVKAKKEMDKLIDKMGLSPKEAFYESIRTTYDSPVDIHRFMEKVYYDLLKKHNYLNSAISKSEFNKKTLREKVDFVFKSVPGKLKNTFTYYYYGFLMCHKWDTAAYESFIQSGSLVKDVEGMLKKFVL